MVSEEAEANDYIPEGRSKHYAGQKSRKQIRIIRSSPFSRKRIGHAVGRVDSRVNSIGTSALRSFVKIRGTPIRVRQAINRSPYSTSKLIGKKSGGGRGRPKGSYDSRYAAYGGVYGYRKVLNAQLRERRLEYLRSRAINPQQQAILAQIEARNRAEQVNPENQVIPDTAGVVRTRTFQQEVDDAANIIP